MAPLLSDAESFFSTEGSFSTDLVGTFFSFATDWLPLATWGEGLWCGVAVVVVFVEDDALELKSRAGILEWVHDDCGMELRLDLVFGLATTKKYILQIS